MLSASPKPLWRFIFFRPHKYAMMPAGLLPSSLAEHFDHQAITINYMMMNKNQSCYSRKYETICVVHFFTACIDGTPQAI
jgi:hypothetical protein